MGKGALEKQGVGRKLANGIGPKSLRPEWSETERRPGGVKTETKTRLVSVKTRY